VGGGLKSTVGRNQSPVRILTYLRLSETQIITRLGETRLRVNLPAARLETQLLQGTDSAEAKLFMVRVRK
jgi:hypothetical protein